MTAKINLIVTAENPNGLAEMVKDFQKFCQIKNQHGPNGINETNFIHFEISDNQGKEFEN